ITVVETPSRRAVVSPASLGAGPDFEHSLGWLNQAERPLIIAGLDVLTHRAEANLRRLAEQLNAPLITTYKAKGVLLPEDHALALGGAGLSPVADEHLLGLDGEADVILAAGYDPIEMRAGWQNPWPAGSRVIDFSAVANTHYMHQAAINFVGDVASGLNALGESVQPGTRWPDGELEAAAAALRQAFPRDEEWGPSAVIDECRARTPRDTVATVDAGAHRILLSQMWGCYAPRGLLRVTDQSASSGILFVGVGQQEGSFYPGAGQADAPPVVAISGAAAAEAVVACRRSAAASRYRWSAGLRPAPHSATRTGTNTSRV
ncbi:MAG TPA: thiamine pyrophosphate-binding protein, partial [Planctomycetes bacterium]|nr:thiamine pyrophosphate-binding protein [Planctomycetota bacterium]